MSDNELLPELFEEPSEFYKPPPEPTTVSFQRQHARSGEPTEVTLRLVGKSPLWGHLLWNAGKVTTDSIDERRDEWIKDKTVLELGAAAALPSLVASLTAKRVVITDYPDPDLLENIEINVKTWEQVVGRKLPITVEGYIWGNEVRQLLERNQGHKYDFIIMSDLIFNHSEHEKLIRCCDELLTQDGILFVVFTPHRPKLLQADLEFFKTANTQAGFVSNKIIEMKMKPMFEEDDETKDIRAMVYGYLVTRQPPPN
jgi:nicotinamide N-methyltransferase